MMYVHAGHTFHTYTHTRKGHMYGIKMYNVRTSYILFMYISVCLIKTNRQYTGHYVCGDEAKSL